jgi:hypothetical protein
VALAQRLRAPRPDGAVSALPADRIRRCTFRRLIAVDQRPGTIYDVECLYPDRQVALPLGDLDTARPICNACEASHIFRADED